MDDTVRPHHSPRLIETWDVLKFCPLEIVRSATMINRNMRCIEIHPTRPLCRSDYGLIETWDVLKSSRRPVVPVLIKINRNMRYIEIRQTLRMRPSQPRLIETWDVLKCEERDDEWWAVRRLIETWDVLKLSWLVSGDVFNLINRNMRCIVMDIWSYGIRQCCEINRNMRCIEMLRADPLLLALARLIETWDV